MAGTQFAGRFSGLAARHVSTRTIRYGFLLAGFASLVLSVSLWFGGYREEGLFVGLWVPSILSLGTLVSGGRHE